jgi:hypothetical protein
MAKLLEQWMLAKIKPNNITGIAGSDEYDMC